VSEVGALAPAAAILPARAGERARGVEQDGLARIRGQLAETRRDLLGRLRAGHRDDNTGVPLSRISWLVTVGICLIAALLLLLEGYLGYSGILLAVGAAAAVNLT
jgi:hypothetical protein